MLYFHNALSVSKQFFLMSLLSLGLLGCDQTQAVLKEQEKMQSEIDALGKKLDALQQSLLALTTTTSLSVKIEKFDYAIKEQMFDPKLFGHVSISAHQPESPAINYVHLQINVEFKKIGMSLVEYIWITLKDGQGEAGFQISLPEHEMQETEALVSFTPLSWARGMPVSLAASGSLAEHAR